MLITIDNFLPSMYLYIIRTEDDANPMQIIIDNDVTINIGNKKYLW